MNFRFIFFCFGWRGGSSFSSSNIPYVMYIEIYNNIGSAYSKINQLLICYGFTIQILFRRFWSCWSFERLVSTRYIEIVPKTSKGEKLLIFHERILISQPLKRCDCVVGLVDRLWNNINRRKKESQRKSGNQNQIDHRLPSLNYVLTV